MKSKAVFLDRDGTIIEDTGYLADPDDIVLLPGSAEAIQRFAEAGYLVVVASNQSGIARGKFDEADLERIHERFEELLAHEGVNLDGAYYCPYLDGPEATVRQYRRDSELRKPKPGMLLQAARELNVDLKQSWMIGDAPSDVQAGVRAGCKTVLLTNSGGDRNAGDFVATHVVSDLREAADAVLGPRGRSRGSRPRSAGGAVEGRRAIEVLERIHEAIERAHRPRRQDDFSLIRLVAALLQMLAIVGGLWGALALFDDAAVVATPRLLLACFLQLASLSAFAVDRFR
ncbi:MAG: D-glycero-alpha-D-manno-heptose-1,7-bisphosphate 7-phosphatase [Phycisphaerae bacterium]